MSYHTKLAVGWNVLAISAALSIYLAAKHLGLWVLMIPPLILETGTWYLLIRLKDEYEPFPPVYFSSPYTSYVFAHLFLYSFYGAFVEGIIFHGGDQAIPTFLLTTIVLGFFIILHGRSAEEDHYGEQTANNGWVDVSRLLASLILIPLTIAVFYFSALVIHAVVVGAVIEPSEIMTDELIARTILIVVASGLGGILLGLALGNHSRGIVRRILRAITLALVSPAVALLTIALISAHLSLNIHFGFQSSSPIEMRLAPLFLWNILLPTLLNRLPFWDPGPGFSISAALSRVTYGWQFFGGFSFAVVYLLIDHSQWPTLVAATLNVGLVLYVIWLFGRHFALSFSFWNR